jgi:hypothetical protein
MWTRYRCARAVADIGLSSTNRSRIVRHDDGRKLWRCITVNLGAFGGGNSNENLTIHARSQFIDRVSTPLMVSDKPSQHVKSSLQIDAILYGIHCNWSRPQRRCSLVRDALLRRRNDVYSRIYSYGGQRSAGSEQRDRRLGISEETGESSLEKERRRCAPIDPRVSNPPAAFGWLVTSKSVSVMPG